MININLTITNKECKNKRVKIFFLCTATLVSFFQSIQYAPQQ